MKKLLTILLTVIAAFALFAFAGCKDNNTNNPGGDNPPVEKTTTDVTYHFVNGEDSFEIKKTQDKGSALSYEYSKVNHENVWYSSADLQTVASVADGDTMDVYTSFTDIEFYVMFRSVNKTLSELSIESTLRAGDITLPVALEREGYTFAGWETDGNSYSAGSSYEVKKGGDLTFVAKWNVNSYTVTYVDGESKTTATQEYSSAVAKAPEKTGYEFLGWFDGENKVETIAGDVTLTAKWQAYKYNVTFDLGAYSGDFGYENGEFEYSQVITLGQLSAAGYKFNGWQIKVDDGAYENISDSYTVGGNINAENISFKALFAKNVYAVTVHGKDGASAVCEILFGDDYYVALDEYAVEGFDGWYFDEAKTKLITYKTTAAADAAAEFDVYGSYTGSVFTATFITDQGENEVSLPYGAEFPEAVAEHGYVFGGWYDEDGVLCAKMPVGDITLTAEFEKAKFTLSYSDGSSAVPESVTAEYLTEITVANHSNPASNKTFKGWSYNGKTYQAGDTIVLEDDILLVAVWDTYSIHVRLVDWDGYEIVNGDFDAGYSISVPTDSIYGSVAEFAGFYNYDIFGRTVVYKLGDVLTEDFEATAYYVNNSSNPATRGKQLTFMNVDDLFFKKPTGSNTYYVSGREWHYELENGKQNPVMDNFYIGNSLPNDLNLPATYHGELVTGVATGYSLSAGAFSVHASSRPYEYDRYKVKGAIYVPSAYTWIGSYAFTAQEAKVIEVGINSQITTLESQCAFLNNSKAVYGFPANLKRVEYYGLSTGSYITGVEDSFVLYDDEGQRITKFPSSITYIGPSAFRGCDVFETIDLTNVTYLGTLAFSGNNNIKNVIFGNNLKTVPAQSFRYCDGLMSVNIPAQVTKIEANAFSSCSNLRDVTFELENSKLETIEPFAFYYSPLTKVILPDNVTEIGYAAFSYNFYSAVPSWSVNDDVTSFVTEVKLPANLRKVGSFAFYGAQIDSIELPDKLEIIGAASFMNTNIKKLEIPDSVVQIEDLAFAKLVKYRKTITKEDEFVLRMGKGITQLGGRTSEISPNLVAKGMVFRGFDNIVGIEFPEDSELVDICDYAFLDMRGLRGEISFPSKVEYIGGSMFSFCRTGGSTGNIYWQYDLMEGADISRIFVPKSVKNIGSEAFAFLTKLTEVVFENNYEEGATLDFLHSVFKGCTSLKTITLPCQTRQLYASNLDKDTGVFTNCTALTEVIFEGRGEYGDDGECRLYTATFWGCTKLSRITTYRNSMIQIYMHSSYKETDIDHFFLKDCPGVELRINKNVSNASELINEYKADTRWSKSNGVRFGIR